MKTDKRNGIFYYIGYYIGGPFTIALAFYWYNTIYFMTQIGYWKCLVLSGVWLLAANLLKWFHHVAVFILVLSILLQVLKWISVIELPIFKI